MSSIPPSSRALPLAAAVLTLLLHPAHADFTNVIAHEAAATQASSSWFTGLPTWHVDTSAVPASPAVPADSPARDMVFGAPLAFAVFPVNPTSSFAVDLTFLDDGGDRVQSLTVGGVAVAPRVALPPKAILAARFNISSAAVQPVPGFPGALGLTFSLSALAGPNAILSSFVLYSSNTSDPPVAPPVLPTPTHALPRLTPRPLSVAGADVTAMDLMGTWDFDAAPSPRLLGALRSGSRSEAVAALSANAGAWAPIAVPGEYTLQGWRMPAFQPVVYHTSFTPPASWAAAGLRTKLRCDGIYSDATVYVNGGLAGGHLGGFTPFEVDVSSLLAAGGASNNLTIVVVGMSLADTLASGSQYAAHDLGGITRKLYLVAVPDVSLADVHAVTSFPAGDYTRATLWLNISVANDGSATTTSAVAVAAELTFTGREEASAFPPGIAGGATVAYQQLSLAVANPPLWDPEHPNLHNLTLTLTYASGATEVVQMRIGFRDVQVVGTNRVYVNGRPIKAHGTTRHEAHPLAGRSLWGLEPAGKHINYIRTSHYPPAEELMIAADELGMFIELEMPFCWASGNSGSAAFNYTVQAQREAMVFNRNHPSVIMWSLGNESPWTTNFNSSLADFLREIDSTRLFMFDGGDGQAVPPLNVISVHYPSFDGPGQYANGSTPTLFGEYAHLNCYNRREIAADQGVRDIWGLGIDRMWELIWASDGVLGGCYWAGIDDYFFMPSGKPVGYGEWGVVDAWRRQKPETFLVRNTYSPVKISVPAPGSSWAPSLTVENRFDFTDLSEVSFAWRILESGLGGQGAASGPPHTDGLVLTLADLPPPPLTGTMQINVTSPRGFLVNAWEFPLSASAPPPGLRLFDAAAPSVTELPDGRLLIQDAAGAFSWYVDAAGSVSGNTSAGGPLLASGPTLMVLDTNDDGGMQLTEDMPPIVPFNDPLTSWVFSNRIWAVVGGSAVVTVTGAYAEAAGTYTFSFDGAARLQAAFSFTWTQASTLNPRQIGLVFDAAPALNSLSWRRNAPWPSTYPPEHIGRPVGNGVAPNAGPAPGNVTPTCSWSHDQTPLGDADFRSTRHNVTAFELASAGGDGGASALALIADGTQHGRAWLSSDGSVRLLAAVLSNEGGNPFSREAVLPHVTIKAGSVVDGAVVLQMGSALS